MKKFALALVVLLIPLICYASFFDMQRAVIAKKNANATPSPIFEANWNGAVTADDELCATTPCPDTWDSLVSGDENLAVNTTDDTLEITGAGEIRESGSINGFTEVTITFTIEFSTLDPDDSNETPDLWQIYNNADDWIARYRIMHLESGESYRIAIVGYKYDDTFEAPTNVDISVTANTTYDAYLYAKRGTDNTADGYYEWGIKDNSASYVTVNTGLVEAYERWNDHGNASYIELGHSIDPWVDNPWTLTIDDVEVYNSDQRPS